jgi:hypothetical protein
MGYTYYFLLNNFKYVIKVTLIFLKSGGTLSLQAVSINKGFERTKDEIGECITEINAKRQIAAIPPVTLDNQVNRCKRYTYP